jgi:hypothetical protein
MEIAEMEMELELERSEERGAKSEATRTSAKVKIECVREGGAGPKRMEMEEQPPGERSY